MAAGKSRVEEKVLSGRLRRRLLPLLALTGAWSVSIVGVAPVTATADTQSDQWYLEAMKAEEMWKVSTGEDIKVAVIDSGVDPSTASLRGQVLPGEDLSKAAGGAQDDYTGHGTTMAELIVGTGKGGGTQGLAPGAKVMSFRTAGADQKGVNDESTLHKAIRAAADSDAKIINMSIAGKYMDSYSQEAVKYAASKGKLMFAGSGNDGDGKNPIAYPAAYPEVVGVGALDKKASAADFSGHGRHVSLSAPGVDIPGWCDESLTKYCDEWGTSHATAIASASAALIWSEHPDWTANQVLRVLMETAGKPKDGKVPSTYLGYGVVRPNRVLLKGEGNPGAPDQNPLDPEASAQTSPSPSGSPGSGETDDKAAGDKENVADSSKPEDDGQLWIILGTGAAVAVLAAGTFAIVRMRRR